MEYNVFAGVDFVLDRVVMTAAGADKNYEMGAFDYVLSGRAYTRLAVPETAVPIRDRLTGKAFEPMTTNTACIFIWSVDQGGTIAVTQGSVRPIDSKNNYRRLKPEMPALPKDHAAFNYWLANYTGAANFVFGVNNWNSAGIAKLMIPIVTLPDRPIYDDIP